jgi:hypothetical protein
MIFFKFGELFILVYIARANTTGHNKSKVNFIKFYQIWNTSIRFNQKHIFVAPKNLKRCTFKKHRCNCHKSLKSITFNKNSHKTTKITKFIILIFFKTIEGIPAMEPKDTFGIWMHHIFFWAIETLLFMSSHDLHFIFPRPPACTKDIVHVHCK